MTQVPDIRAVKRGEEKAFVALYDALNGRVFNFFLKKKCQPEEAKELTQQCFIRLYHYRHSLSDQHPLEKQVYIIAKSVLINHIRNESRRRARELQYSESQALLDTDPSPLEYQQEINDYLTQLTAQLTPTLRRIVWLKVQKGLSNKEIAEELSISVKTVENHITKAYRSMRPAASELLIFIVVLLHR